MDYFGVIPKDVFLNSCYDFEKSETAIVIITSLDSFSSSKYGHWIVLVKSPDGTTFFHDALGYSISWWLGSYAANKFHFSLYNKKNKRVQGQSSLCGLHCLCFAYYMLNNDFNMDGYLDMFTENYDMNDMLIQKLYSSMFNTCI